MGDHVAIWSWGTTAGKAMKIAPTKQATTVRRVCEDAAHARLAAEVTPDGGRAPAGFAGGGQRQPELHRALAQRAIQCGAQLLAGAAEARLQRVE